MPGDPLALLADQKRDNVRNVVRLSQPTQSGHLGSHLSPLWIFRQHVGFREVGGHGIDCDAASPQFLGERLGELLPRCLTPYVHSEPGRLIAVEHEEILMIRPPSPIRRAAS